MCWAKWRRKPPENNARQLLEVNLSKTCLSDASVSVISDKCNNLKQVNLAYCINVTGKCIEDISKCCAKLEKLNINGTNASDASINIITKSLNRPRCLVVGYKAILCDIWNHEHSFNVLTDASLTYIAERCITLRELSLYSRMPKQVITDKGVTTLLNACTGLKVLQIDFDIYQSITDDSMEHISHVTKLQKLGLRGLINLTIKTFNQILTSKPLSRPLCVDIMTQRAYTDLLI